MHSLIWKSFDFSGDSAAIFEVFKNEPFVFFLDSSLKGDGQGRFSFIGFDPFEIYRAQGNNCLGDIKKIWGRYFCPKNEDEKKFSIPFYSGMAGYLGYDLGFQLEKVKRLQKKEDSIFPECLFGFYDCVIAIDHMAARLYVFSTGLPEKNSFYAHKRARERLRQILGRLAECPRLEKSCLWRGDPFCLSCDETDDLEIVSNFTRAAYETAVQKALAYIRAGDIYQVNLAQRFFFDAQRHNLEIEPAHLYSCLRALSPSNSSGYFNCGDFQILSSSPESFLRLHNGIVRTRPMKGTRQRSDNPRENQRLKRELLSSKKDRAELLMITDLERNDLGRVCEYGSVMVRQMRILEEYATVFQTTSSVTGILQKGRDVFDLIRASFPGGSITGCPKIRAMAVIEELEPSARAVYTGSLGYVSFSGDMDLNILIRTLLVNEEKIFFHAGGGIVCDSTPQKEYEEIMIKSRAMRGALGALAYSKAGI